MHILHIETGRNLYGGALQVVYLVKGLAARGYQNTLVCPENSRIASTLDSYANVSAISMSGDLDLRFGLKLLRTIRSAKPDLIHVHSRRGADVWGALAGRLTKIPAVVTRRVDNPENPVLARLKYHFYRRVITISEGIRRVVLAEGIPADKVVCVSSAVDTKRFTPDCDREWFCKEFKLNQNARVIGTIAQLIDRKGHRFLIDAVPRIVQQFPESIFLFLGKGPLQKALQRACDAKNIASHILFAGFRHDIERILPCLDMVVHPALMEGLGVSLLQAAAAGVPTIASNVGGIPEIVHDNENGYLVPPGDSDAIADRCTRLLEDTAMSKKFGNAGIELVKKAFSIDAMVEGNLNVYKGLLYP